MLSEQDKALLERVFPELPDQLKLLAYPDMLGRLLDAARAESSSPDLKAVAKVLEWAAGIASREEVAPMDDEHILRLVYDDPEWGDNTVIAEVFVRFFRRAAELHTQLTEARRDP